MTNTNQNTEDFTIQLKNLRNENVLVVGGLGFLGKHLCKMLISVGSNVTVFDLGMCKTPSTEIRYIQGDITRSEDVARAVKNCKIVFHTASPSPLVQDKSIFHKVNVQGTETLLKCCQVAKTEKLIYVSSASVVFDGTDQFSVTEDWAEKNKSCPLSHYALSKLEAENIVLRQKAAELAVCSIRPHSIFGPGDANFLPSLVKTAGSGGNYFAVGGGSNLVNFTYVENVAFSLCLAAVHLKKDSSLNRQAYFITNKEVINFWDFLSQVYIGLGYQKPLFFLSKNALLFVSALSAKISFVYPRYKPTLTREKVLYSAVHHFYCDDKATRDFGYWPIVSVQDGLMATLRDYTKDTEVVVKSCRGRGLRVLLGAPEIVLLLLLVAFVWKYLG